jgi:hypothetical protein
MYVSSKPICNYICTTESNIGYIELAPHSWNKTRFDICSWGTVFLFVSDLWQVSGFSTGTLVSSTNKTDHHDITEILLKVTLNTRTVFLIFIMRHENMKYSSSLFCLFLIIGSSPLIALLYSPLINCNLFDGEIHRTNEYVILNLIFLKTKHVDFIHSFACQCHVHYTKYYNATCNAVNTHLFKTASLVAHRWLHSCTLH